MVTKLRTKAIAKYLYHVHSKSMSEGATGKTYVVWLRPFKGEPNNERLTIYVDESTYDSWKVGETITMTLENRV